MAAADSGLGTLKEVQAKVLYLPSSDGVFGKGLEETLEKRKEQKDQLNDLLPEFNFAKNKRKFDNENRDNWNNKIPRSSYTEKPKPSYSNVHMNKQNVSKTFSRPSQKQDVKSKEKENIADKKDKFGKNWDGFRIPKKQNS